MICMEFFVLTRAKVIWWRTSAKHLKFIVRLYDFIIFQYIVYCIGANIYLINQLYILIDTIKHLSTKQKYNLNI